MPTESIHSRSKRPSDTWDALLNCAVARFAATGTSMTPLREAILSAMWSAGEPLGAYELADRVRKDDGRPVSPNSVYRILSSFQQIGLVRRIESRHAFVVLGSADAGCDLFLLCTSCGGVTPVRSAAVDAMLESCASSHGFSPSGQSVEMTGRCLDCSNEHPEPPAPSAGHMTPRH